MTGRWPRTGTDSLATELLEALWSYHLLKQTKLRSRSRIEALGRIKVMGLLVDDILLRLAKLGETKRGTWNFSQVLKQLPTGDNSRVSDLRKRIAEYQKRIATIVTHRNRRIAHVSKHSAADLESPLEIRAALREAVSLLDDLAGDRHEFFVSKLDLRASYDDQVTGKTGAPLRNRTPRVKKGPLVDKE